LIEDRPGTKTLPGKGGGWKTDCQTQATDSQTMNEYSEPGEQDRALEPEEQILTRF
jgi:hypothetical protein